MKIQNSCTAHNKISTVTIFDAYVNFKLVWINMQQKMMYSKNLIYC